MIDPYWADTDADLTLYHGDSVDVLPGLPDDSVSLICTDPPYGVDLMGKAWDKALPDPTVWAECLRVLKPGGFMFAFMTPRLDCLWRFGSQGEGVGFDVGHYLFEWVYADGFPKGRDLPDGRKGGRQSMKPAHEAIVVAQKHRAEKTIAANVEKHGTGGLYVDGCMIPFPGDGTPESDGGGWGWEASEGPGFNGGWNADHQTTANPKGRHPANLAVTDQALGRRSKYYDVDRWAREHVVFTECGALAYCPKAATSEKDAGTDGNPHPSVKPLALVSWLLTLGTPDGGLVLDPFAGTGTTLVAAKALGIRAVGVELNDTPAEPFCTIARQRIEAQDPPAPTQGTLL